MAKNIKKVMTRKTSNRRDTGMGELIHEYEKSTKRPATELTWRQPQVAVVRKLTVLDKAVSHHDMGQMLSGSYNNTIDYANGDKDCFMFNKGKSDKRYRGATGALHSALAALSNLTV